VSHKDLTHLNHSALFDLSITHLDASYNNVRQIDRNQFVHHKLLQTLILSGNKRLDVPSNEPLVNADKLEIFECENCGITAIGAQTLEGKL
jgi:Leucine-rich repeat (LRR) protein